MSISFLTPKKLLGLVLLVSFSLMLWTAINESATFDEVAHIPAGYSYVKLLDYRLNPEHPPLIKMISAIPLLGLNLNFPTEHPGWKDEINGQWTMGAQFLYGAGNDADQIISWSRVGPIFLTILLALFIYFWSNKLMGPKWALLPTFIFSLSPNILAHGHYVTTDIGAALGITASTYFFIKYLESSSSKNLLFAGLVLGLALLTKFSTILLLPFFFGITALHFILKSDKKRIKEIFMYLGKFALVFFVAYVFVIYPIYAFITSNMPQNVQEEEALSIIGGFAGGPVPEGEMCGIKRCAAEMTFIMNKYDATRPFGHYLFGLLMIIQRASGGNSNYFLGVNSGDGSPFYFPIVYALKEPLAILLLLISAKLLWLTGFAKGLMKFNWAKTMDWGRKYFPEICMMSFVAFYWLNSVTSPLNIGFRHLIPAIPFTYIVITRTLEVSKISFKIKRALISLVVLGLIIEASIVAPFFLSNFNALAGGYKNGYKFATDSNYDWGQDLHRLKEFVDENNIEKISIDYFGGGNPGYYFGDKSVNWWSAKGNPKDQGIEWLAISANSIQGNMQHAVPEMNRKAQDEYPWLKELRPFEPGMGNIPAPDYRVGSSIFVYKL